MTLDGERAYPSNASAPSCMPGQRTWGGVSFPADGDARPRHLGRRNGILLIFIYKDIHVNTLLFIFSVLLPKVEELVEERKLILWGDMVLGGPQHAAAELDSPLGFAAVTRRKGSALGSQPLANAAPRFCWALRGSVCRSRGLLAMPVRA